MSGKSDKDRMDRSIEANISISFIDTCKDIAVDRTCVREFLVIGKICNISLSVWIFTRAKDQVHQLHEDFCNRRGPSMKSFNFSQWQLRHLSLFHVESLRDWNKIKVLIKLLKSFANNINITELSMSSFAVTVRN